MMNGTGAEIVGEQTEGIGKNSITDAGLYRASRFPTGFVDLFSTDLNARVCLQVLCIIYDPQSNNSHHSSFLSRLINE